MIAQNKVELLGNSSDQEAQNIKLEAENKISHILEELDIENAINTKSKAEDLLQKLRLLKYQQLILKNDKSKNDKTYNQQILQRYTSHAFQSGIHKHYSPQTRRAEATIQLQEFQLDKDEDDVEDNVSIDCIKEQQDQNQNQNINERDIQDSLHAIQGSPLLQPFVIDDDVNSIDQSGNSELKPKSLQGEDVFHRKNKRLLSSLTFQQGPADCSITSPESHHQTKSLNQHKKEKQVITEMPVVNEDEVVQLNTEDIDDLIKVLTGNKESIWLPYFLKNPSTFRTKMTMSRNSRSRQEDFSPEAKMFILDHFTEKEFNFQQFFLEMDQIKDDIPISPSWTYKQKSSDNIKLSRTVNNYDFDFFEFCETQQNSNSIFTDYCIFVFLQFDVYKTLNIKNHKVMFDFFDTIDQSYKDNPYHNCIHAIDVTNSTAFFLKSGLTEIVSEFEVACLIVSSIAHDLSHPGFNNSFMVNTKSKLALIYNDQSVLENYHASRLFQILQDDRTNIVKHLDDVNWKGFRKYCLTLILDTDLQKHFQLLSKFKNLLGEPNLSDEQNRLLVLSMTIKCADVGHGAKSLELHKNWSRRIIEEFFHQGDVESQIGLTVMPMCDRKLSVTKSQEGFLKAIVLPLFEAFNEFMKSSSITLVCIKQINDNIQYWQDQQIEEQVLFAINFQGDRQNSFFKDTDYVLDQIKFRKKDLPILSSLGQIMFNK